MNEERKYTNEDLKPIQHMTQDKLVEAMTKRITPTSFVCPQCKVKAVGKQLNDFNGNPVKGIEFVCPLCGEKI